MSSSPVASVLTLPLEPQTTSVNVTSNSLEQQVSAIPHAHEPNKFPQKRSFGFNLSHVAKVVRTHFLKHVGAGLVASVAYFDPGNWSVDLQAGSEYGYKMLFVVLLAGIIAVILQALATKLGCVTGKDLAVHCRLLLHDHPKHPRLVRWLALYPLYFFSECAIVATDLCELLGSSIALVLFIPSLPLYAAVLITALDVLVVLIFLDPSRSQGKPAKLFELFIIALVVTVLVSFVILIVKLNPVWVEVFKGYLPSKTIGQNSNALYTSIGIVGATVMPHALFLGSSLATQNRDGQSFLLPNLMTTQDDEQDDGQGSTLHPHPNQVPRKSVGRWLASLVSAERIKDSLEEDAMIDRYRFVKTHLTNATVDIVLSLLGCAGVINSAILITAATVFFYQAPLDQRGSPVPASLFDTYDIIRERIGKPAAVIFAGALLTAGQSAAITATLSGQVVSSGFIAWRLSPFLTRLTTRMIALVPATIVAAVVGKDGINALLVASQFILSLVLPFTVLPLVWLTSNERIMSVPIPEYPRAPAEALTNSMSQIDKSASIEKCIGNPPPQSSSKSLRSYFLKLFPRLSSTPQTPPPQDGPRMKNFANSRSMKILGYVIFTCILAADTIAIISLGKDS